MWDDKKWNEAYRIAETELKDLSITPLSGTRGFEGERPKVFLHVPVKSNKELISQIERLGWKSYHGHNVNGVRIKEYQKSFAI